MRAVALERPPPPSEALRASLRALILRERQKKKQEQEADAEVKRKRKEDAMTLAETQKQIFQANQRLAQLNEEKHQLFLQLKRQFNEDDNRRQQLLKESSEVMEVFSGYPGVSMSSNPQLSPAELQPMPLRNPHYKVPASHTLIPAGTLKRRRSPSLGNYPQYDGYKPAITQTAFQKQKADAIKKYEEERQRKEDAMTLAETQILQAEQRLDQLKEEKHQLVVQLKQNLKEADNHWQQLLKESSEVMEVYSGCPGVSMSSNPQLSLAELQPMPLRNPHYKVPASHTLIPAGTLKRRRSPSLGNYPQYDGYKPAITQTAFQEVDDTRRCGEQEYVRPVLWKKPCQYEPFYTTATTISYSNSGPDPGRSYKCPRPSEQSESSSQATPSRHNYIPQLQQRPLNPYGKPSFSEEHSYSGPQIRPATHVSLHGGTIPIQQPPQGAKTGGITSGYPIRPPASAPTATTPHSVYVSQPSSGTRLVYSQPGSSQPISSIRYSVPPMQRET